MLSNFVQLGSIMKRYMHCSDSTNGKDNVFYATYSCLRSQLNNVDGKSFISIVVGVEISFLVCCVWTTWVILFYNHVMCSHMRVLPTSRLQFWLTSYRYFGYIWKLIITPLLCLLWQSMNVRILKRKTNDGWCITIWRAWKAEKSI